MTDEIIIEATEEMTFYVAFRDSAGLFWWLRWLKKGFGHCYYMVDVEGGVIVVEHHSSRFTTDFFAVDAEALAKRQIGHMNTRVVKFTHRPEPKPTYRLNMSCVALTINGIGLQQKLAITPYTLYHTLLRLGGKELQRS